MSPTSSSVTWFLLQMLFVWWLTDTSGHRVSGSRQRQAKESTHKEQPELIIDANHHYSNYNYADSHQPPPNISPQLHSNELPIYGHTNDHMMKNLTASVGRNTTFECVFPDLKKDFRLVWMHMHKDRHTVLAMQDMVILKNGRISVRSHANTTFYLTIHDVREEDRGNYMCQVNTVPMRSKTGHLEVNVPPTFVEKLTTSDLDVRENSSASLQCTAKGRPTPQISWRREDGGPIFFDKSENPIYELKSDYLNISEASRTNSGAFLCIASNGIPSPISKRIFLGVSFPPVIKSKKESIGAHVGSSTVLECSIESYPRPSVHWLKDDQMPPIIHSNHKYEISLLDANSPYRFIVRLKIMNVHKADLGKYSCVAKNTLAESKASMHVYEIERKILPTHQANLNVRPKSKSLNIFTTSPAKSETEQSKITHKVTDNFSMNQESAKTEVLDYETNFISPEMSNESVKKNKASTPHLALCWSAMLCLLLIWQRMFVLVA